MASAVLASHDNVVVRISGAGTLAKEPFPYNDIWDPLRRLFDAFGLDRCMWASEGGRALKINAERQEGSTVKTHSAWPWKR